MQMNSYSTMSTELNANEHLTLSTELDANELVFNLANDTNGNPRYVTFIQNDA